MSVNCWPEIKWSFFARKIQFNVFRFFREKGAVYTHKVLMLYYYMAIRIVIIYVDRTQIHELPWMWRWEVWGNLNLFLLKTFSCIWGGCLYVGSRNGSSFKFGSLSWFCSLNYPIVMLVRNADSEPHPHPQIRTCLYQGPQGIWAP